MDEAKFFTDNNVAPPTSEAHGVTPEDIRSKLQPVHPRNWRQQGNMLHADTDVGELVNALPYGYILTGTDDKGLPTFRKI